MAIYTSFALASTHTLCKGGTERAKDFMDTFGFKPDDHIPMRLLLDHMSISDCMFTFVKVTKQSEAEARYVLTEYMQYLYTKAVPLSGIDSDSFTIALKAIRKRCEGHNRPVPLAHARSIMASLRRAEADPVRIYALDALRFLATPWHDALSACHAGLSLMDAGRYGEIGSDIRIALTTKLQELIK